MNRISEETAIEYQIASKREPDGTKAMIIAQDAQSSWDDAHLQGYPNVKGIENMSSHHLSASFHNLRKLILAIEHLGTGRIDEQRLTTREPWLEVYRFRKDL